MGDHAERAFEYFEFHDLLNSEGLFVSESIVVFAVPVAWYGLKNPSFSSSIFHFHTLSGFPYPSFDTLFVYSGHYWLLVDQSRYDNWKETSQGMKYVRECSFTRSNGVIQVYLPPLKGYASY